MIVVISVLLFLLAVCSILEVSFSSVNIIRIKNLMDKGNKRAKIIYDLYETYSESMTTILVVNCIISVSVSSLTTHYFSNVLGEAYLFLITALLTVFILIFTEIIPKILAREYAVTFALDYAYVIKYLVIIFKPVNSLIVFFENRIKNENKVTATKDELVEIVKTIEDEGVIEEKESFFLQKALELKKLKVKNVMVEKEDVSYLYVTDSSTKVKECIFRDNHDRIPIIDKENKVVGILYEVDLLDEILEGRNISIKKSMKEPIFVKQSSDLSLTLELLHNARAHMAVVVDKDKNFLGIVTIEDIINELMKS